MSVKTLNVGIIGGGIGGLALAIALRKAQVKVTLFEKSKSSALISNVISS